MFSVRCLSEEQLPFLFEFYETRAFRSPATVSYGHDFAMTEEELDLVGKQLYGTLSVRQVHRQWVERLVQEERLEGAIAFFENTALGFCGFGKKERYPFLARELLEEERASDGKTLAVTALDIAFDADEFEQIGAVLLGAAVRACGKMGLRRIEAYPHMWAFDEAHAYERAVKIYERFGFSVLRRGQRNLVLEYLV